MVRLLMRMTVFETLGVGDLKDITTAFTGPPEDSALAPLKGAHKSSAILKRYMVLASKRLEQLLMDERLQPHAEELTQALDALESSSPDTRAGALAATVSGACVEGAPQWLSTVHATLRALTSLATCASHLSPPGPTWQPLLARAQQLVSQDASQAKKDVLWVTCRLIKGAVGQAAGCQAHLLRLCLHCAENHQKIRELRECKPMMQDLPPTLEGEA